jgi:hypothetical protein
VSRLTFVPSSIVSKAAVAVVAFALALTAVARVAVRATDDATEAPPPSSASSPSA